MQIKKTSLQGLFEVQLNEAADIRGSFARYFCEEEFRRLGLVSFFLQSNISTNLKKGTLRGMHFQKAPFAETKLIICVSGSAFDVLIDLRSDSKTYKQWQSFDLSVRNLIALYVPSGFAHGFLTLEDNTNLIYQMSEVYKPEFASGVRWNDPAFAIDWPQSDSLIISEKDQKIKDFAQ